MADDDDPPRKFYELKPREFERANPPPTAATEAGDASAKSPPAPFDPTAPIRLNEIIAAANAPGPALPKTRRATTEVHAVLAENLARETAAGLNELAPRPDRRTRRGRDYVRVMLIVNVPLFLLGIFGIHTANVMLAVSAFGGVGLCSAAITWVMWVVMDKY